MQEQIMLPTRDVLPQALNLTNKVIAEVGVYQGWYSEILRAINPSKLYLIDPWITQDKSIYPTDHSNLSNNQFNDIYNGLVNKYKDDSVVEIIRDFSVYAAQRFDNFYFDMVYIDAVHTHESVLIDMATWFPKVKNEGWLCGHDFTGDFTGVKQAVDSFTRVTGQKMTLMSMECWGTWGIKKEIKK